MNKDLSKLEAIIGYSFKDIKLLKHALTHSTYAFESGRGSAACNERLEFLGDAVLEAVSSEFLYKTYPDKSEGEMSRLRASLVCEYSLAQSAKDISLGAFLYLGKGEDKTGGRERPSVTSDAFEALIGAIFLDGGFTNAKEFVLRFVLNDIENKSLFYDSKTILQEYSQEMYKVTPVYQMLGESGPDHKKVFDAVVFIADTVMGRGKGNSKKDAEQHAAYDALIKIRKVRK